MNGSRGRACPKACRRRSAPTPPAIGWVFQYALVDKTGKHASTSCAPSRTSRCATRSAACPASPRSRASAATRSSTRSRVDPDQLRAYGVTLDEVTDGVRQSNNDVGGRIIEICGREYFVRGRGYITRPCRSSRRSPSAPRPSGTPLRVKDVARVRFGPDIRRGLARVDGEGEAVGAIVRHALRRERARRHRAREEEARRAQSRASRRAWRSSPTYDRSALIERSIDTLKHALIEEAIAVSLVILLFLLHFRSALLPILSLPIAVLLVVHPDGAARHPVDDHEPGRDRHRHRRHRRRRDRDDRGVPQEARARAARPRARRARAGSSPRPPRR